jgi:hypothetical protein
LKDTGKVYFFSDCAYIESVNLDDLVKYIREIRRTLLEEGYYLKGAIGPGALDASEAHSSQEITNSTIRKQREKVVKGSVFGTDVVPIYALQDSLRGIGIRIDKRVADVFEKRHYRVNSCHLPQSNSTHAECFDDIKFDDRELEDKILRAFIRTFFTSKTKSKKYGRYYIPFVLSWINSTDFSAVEVDEKKKKIHSQSTPLIFNMLLNGTFEKYFADLTGIEYIYFAFLNKIYSECANSQKLVEKVVGHVANKKRMVSRLENLPECILNGENRDEFLKYLSRKVMGVPLI